MRAAEQARDKIDELHRQELQMQRRHDNIEMLWADVDIIDER